jgi:hypothetical protein
LKPTSSHTRVLVNCIIVHNRVLANITLLFSPTAHSCSRQHYTLVLANITLLFSSTAHSCSRQHYTLVLINCTLVFSPTLRSCSRQLHTLVTLEKVGDSPPFGPRSKRSSYRRLEERDSRISPYFNMQALLRGLEVSEGTDISTDLVKRRMVKGFCEFGMFSKADDQASVRTEEASSHYFSNLEQCEWTRRNAS